MNNENTFCLDPSCFVTLQRLNDSLKTLNEFTNREPHIEVYIPTNIYDVIILEPELKFKKLPSVIKEWLMLNPENDIRGMNKERKNEYVRIMREIIEKFRPISAKTVADNITKLGVESIHRENVIELFGSIKGKILFEIMTVSSNFKAKIIAFSHKTASLLNKLKITVIESSSKLKHEIKTNRRIQTGLLIMLFSMGLPEVQEFINIYKLDPFPFTVASTTALGAFGVLIIGNGS